MGIVIEFSLVPVFGLPTLRDGLGLSVMRFSVASLLRSKHESVQTQLQHDETNLAPERVDPHSFQTPNSKSGQKALLQAALCLCCKISQNQCAGCCTRIKDTQ
jgi:hypothetical protein